MRASLNQSFAAMLAACLDTDQVSRVFGVALGISLAVVLALTSVIQFFRSEAMLMGDVIDGKDSY